MTQLSTLLDQLSPHARTWVALGLTVAGVVLTALGTARQDASLSGVGSALLLAGGVLAPTGSGRPPGDP